MLTHLVRPTLLSVLVMATGMPAASAQSTADLKKRCDQLTSYFDRYGTSRSENSDGARNHTRIGAGLECEEARYVEGITEMEALLRRKNFDVPSLPGDLAQNPWPMSSMRPNAVPR